MSAARGELTVEGVDVRPEKYVGVVLASRGYPQSGPSGLPIAGVERADAPRGRRACSMPGQRDGADGTVVTAGGRVLTVVAHAAPRSKARSRRPTMPCAKSSSTGCSSVRDIGRKAVEGIRQKG